MTLRWPLVGSLVALIVGAGVAALVLAFCSNGDGSAVSQRSTSTSVSRTATATRTPKSGTPVTTGTPEGTASAGTPSAETATPGDETPPEDTPDVSPSPSPGETAQPGETPLPQETPPPPPTAGTATPVPPTATPPPVLPDLVLLDMFVSNDRLGLILGNQGEAELPVGQEIGFRVRGVMAEAVTLTEDLLPGTSVSIVLESQVIYQPELVLAVADPGNVIPEEDDNNNGIAKQLAPDVAPDLAVHGVFRAVETQRLLVVIRNPTDAPASQATVVVTVYLGGATEPTDRSTHQVTIEPLGFETVEIIGVAAVPGTEVRVVVEMTDPPDANPANNQMTVTIS